MSLPADTSILIVDDHPLIRDALRDTLLKGPIPVRVSMADSMESALELLGAPFDSPLVRRTPEARRLGDGRVLGEVIAVDRFGNLISNIVAMHGGRVDIAGRSLEVRRAYADVREGELTALVGSLGFVEVAVRDGSAAAALRVGKGAPVSFHPPFGGSVPAPAAGT